MAARSTITEAIPSISLAAILRIVLSSPFASITEGWAVALTIYGSDEEVSMPVNEI